MERSSAISALTVNVNRTQQHKDISGDLSELNIPYAVCDALVAIFAVFGNGLVIYVFSQERKLRRRTNYYIISLATADLLVGLFAIPFAILASIGLPRNLHACLFTVSVLVVLCTISIFCLVAVSIDRYWAILHPMEYSRNVRTKTAIVIICICWVAGTIVGFLPLMGWNAGKKSDAKCIFTEVMDYNYLVFLYFATIIFPALLIAAFYAHIYRVVVKQLQQIVTMNPSGCKDQSTGTMLRLLGAQQKREVKATQNLSRIVIFFIICWFPLYTINFVQAFCPHCNVNPVLLNFCIILSHLNSVGNPLLYAYHLKDFRAALKNFMYKLLFPKSAEAKAASLVVVADRAGSLTPHQPRNMKTNQTNLLRQVTDLKDQKNVSFEKRKELQIISALKDAKENEAFVNSDGSLNSSDSRPIDDDNSLSSGANNKSCSSPTESRGARLSPIELQTYPATTRDAAGNECIFVIQADINQSSSSRQNLTLEEKT